MKKMITLLLFLSLQMAFAQDNLPITVAPQESPAEDTNVYNTAGIEGKPEFPGGIQKFYSFIGQNYRTPEHPEMESGKVLVKFVVEKDGSLTDFKILHDIGYGSGEEAIRVLQKSPKWTPGRQNGKV